jgi:putative phosphotransacetylase
MLKLICETSMRHVHLSASDVETLFGKGAKLEFSRALSQPNQFLAVQRVALVGAKSTFENVAIIGPERKVSQIEISRTDTFALGVKNVPVRQSGDLNGAPTLIIKTELGQISAAAIVAKRHIHLDPKTAKEHKITDGQIMKIKITGERASVLENVVARVDATYAPAIHIDGDEANATGAAGEVEVLF